MNKEIYLVRGAGSENYGEFSSGIIPRMIAVYRDTKSFLDYKGIETYLAREIVIKS